MEKLRPREFKKLSQTYTAIRWYSLPDYVWKLVFLTLKEIVNLDGSSEGGYTYLV